jgi:hypothetical protein
VRPELAIAAASLAGLAAGPASASDRADALASAFQRWCLSAPPSFQALDAMASAAHLAVQSDDKTDTPAEGAVESKLWDVTDEPTGPYALTGGFAVRHGKTVTICGLAAQDARGDDLRGVLAQPGRFGAPLGVRNSDDGIQRITEFKAPFAHSSILLADGAPQNAAGVILNLIEVREPGR